MNVGQRCGRLLIAGLVGVRRHYGGRSIPPAALHGGHTTPQFQCYGILRWYIRQ